MKTSRWVAAVVIGLAVLVITCQSTFRITKAPVSMSLPEMGNEDFAVARILNATDRNRTYGADGSNAFGNRSAILSFCYWDIQPEHSMGELKSNSIWRLEFREDPSKHVALMGTFIRLKDDFYGDLADRASASAKISAFVFIQGFNVAFVASMPKRVGTGSSNCEPKHA